MDGVRGCLRHPNHCLMHFMWLKGYRKTKIIHLPRWVNGCWWDMKRQCQQQKASKAKTVKARYTTLEKPQPNYTKWETTLEV